MNSEGTDAGGGAGGGGGGGGAEGKGGDDVAVVLSAEYLEVVAMATEPAFDVNTSRCSDTVGNPPIFFAVGASSDEDTAHEDCLVFVLGLAGVDVNLQDEHGNTALFHSSFAGAWRCVKVLLADPRVDLNLPNKVGSTPLHGAVGFGHPKCVELLLQAPGIKINKVDIDVSSSFLLPHSFFLTSICYVRGCTRG
jgi:hypothetical protein